MIEWNSSNKLPSKNYTCGYCGNDISTNEGYFAQNNANPKRIPYVYICHKCKSATYFDTEGEQTPGASFGEKIEDVDDETVEALYNEARECMRTNSFTAVVLCCRKLLMHIAVSKGAETGKKFIEYVEYLSDNNYIPPDAKDEWVDEIRSKGNEANHEIVIMDEADAKDLLEFVSVLMKMIYEFPAKVKRKKPASQ